MAVERFWRGANFKLSQAPANGVETSHIPIPALC